MAEAIVVAPHISILATYRVVNASFIAMKLAGACGLKAASVSMTHAAHKDVLLIKRFDLTYTTDDWTRQAMVSALTMLGSDPSNRCVERARIGPFPQEDLDEALGLAIGFRRVRTGADVLDPKHPQRLSEQPRDVP